jgi:hypothetical protein
MKRLAPLTGLVIAALLGGCAVYPDGTPMYSNGYGGGYSGSDGYDGYATGVPVVPQTNVYMGYSNYSSPGYYGGPGRYYGPGPGYRGYPDRGRPNNGNYGNHDNRGDNGGNHGDNRGGNRGDNGGWHGQPNGGPPPQGAVGGPRGPGGSNAPRPGAGGPPPHSPPQQQAGNGGGRVSGDNARPSRDTSGRLSGGNITQH